MLKIIEEVGADPRTGDLRVIDYMLLEVSWSVRGLRNTLGPSTVALCRILNQILAPMKLEIRLPFYKVPELLPSWFRRA